jgi:hypothetical protein
MKIFNYISEIFDLDVLVCIDAKAKDIKKWAEKNGSKEFNQFLKQNKLDNFDISTEKNSGFLMKAVGNKNFYFLWLKDFENNWKDIEVLLHEIVHLKQYTWDDKLIGLSEVEFEAYFIESTFRGLRRRLFKELKL